MTKQDPAQQRYFQTLNTVLKQQGNGQPQLILDQARLEQNLKQAAARMPASFQPRLAVKSLACLTLLQRASEALNTRRFMLFHVPQALEVLQAFADADILMGKPLPIQALRQCSGPERAALQRVQWLIDTETRLHQYLAWAQAQGCSLRISLEIDIGLHRGGAASAEDLAPLLELIRQHPKHLSLSGLMGYDAHTAKIPSLIQTPEKTYQQSQRSYQQFLDFIRGRYPDLYREDLCWNGGGSLSFAHHCRGTLCNDVSFGSMLLKPADFDIAGLAAFQPALWIAAPVLKTLPYAQLPGLPNMLQWPRASKAVFIYGGYWRGPCVFPAHAKPHMLYGRSSNQEMLQLPRHAEISADDYVFIQPAQSESILPQFAQLFVYADGELKAWPTFRE